jgi:tetratricopeptide (TPR) repeat protein
VTDAIEAHHDSAYAHNLRALCLNALDRPDEALDEYLAATRLDPHNAILVGNLGCAYQERGRLEDATATIRRALSMNPNLPYLYERLADIARQRGDEATAAKELRQAEVGYKAIVDAHPFESPGWRDLARVRLGLGDYPGAQKAREVATEIDRTEALEGPPDAVVNGVTEVRQ